MLNKNDPLIGAVQEVMKKNQAERDAVRLVNEKFGVTDRKALPHERQGEWDAAYKTVLTEGVEALDEAKKKSKLHPGLNTPESMKIRKIAGPGKVQYDPNDGVHIHDNLSDSVRKIRGFIVKDGKVKEIKGFVPGMREGVEILNELSPETLENYKNKRKTQVHAIIRNMKDWQLKKTPQGASDFIINSAEKAAKHAKMIKLAGDKIEGKKGVVAAKRPKKRLEEEELDKKKIKMYGIPNKVKPKRGPLGPEDINAIRVTNDLFRRMEALKKGNVKAAGNVTKAQIKKMQSEEALDEKLVGNQHRIDANKNGRVDGHDFKLLKKGVRPVSEGEAPKTDPYAEGQASSISTVSQPKKEVTPADQAALKKKIMSIKEELSANEKKAAKLKAILKRRIGKEGSESISQSRRQDLEERKMTKDEMRKREKNVKSMKPVSNWEKRYPGRGEEVMYATAAKEAMKEDNEGFNNRHGLSVTASAKKQVVADQLNEKVGIPSSVRQKQKQAAKDAAMTRSRLAREPKVAPSSIGSRIRQGIDAAGAGIAGFTNQALMGKEVAAAGDYAVKNYIGKPLGLSKGTTWDKEYGQEQEKEARAKLNNPTAYGLGAAAGDISNVVSAAGLVKGGLKYGAKKFIKSKADDLAKTTTALPKSTKPVSQAAREPATVPTAAAKVASKPAKPVSQAAREPDEIIMPAKKPDIPSGNAGIRGTFQDKLARARQNAGSDLKARQLPALRRTTEPTKYVRPGVPAVRPTSGPNLPARPGSPNLAAGGATRIVGLSDKAKAGLAAGAAGAAIGGYALNRSLSGNQPPAAQASTTPVAPANAASPQAMAAGAERDKVGVKRIQPAEQPVSAPASAAPEPAPEPAPKAAPAAPKAAPAASKPLDAFQRRAVERNPIGSSGRSLAPGGGSLGVTVRQPAATTPRRLPGTGREK